MPGCTPFGQRSSVVGRRAQRAHDPVLDGEVVLDDVELGDLARALGRREDHAVGARHAQLAPAGVDVGGLGGHARSSTARTRGGARSPPRGLPALRVPREASPSQPVRPERSAHVHQVQQALASSDVIVSSLEHRNANAALNVAGRVLLMVFALGTASVAAVLVYLRADEIIKALTENGGRRASGSQLLALTAPVLLLLVSRRARRTSSASSPTRANLDESFKTLDSVNRLRREDEVAVWRAGSLVAFESSSSRRSTRARLDPLGGPDPVHRHIGLFVSLRDPHARRGRRPDHRHPGRRPR